MSGVLKPLYFLLSVIVAAAAAVYLIVSSDMFREVRIRIFEAGLERVLDSPVVVDGDVRLGFFPDLSIVATDVKLPSDSIENFDLVSLKTARFGLLPKRGLSFPSIHAEGLTVNLLTTEDGVRSWTEPKTPSGDINSAGAEVAQFLGERDVTVKNFKIMRNDEDSGFVFDFGLDSFVIDQGNGGTQTELRTTGEVNGQNFDIKGSFPTGAPFNVTGAAGDLDFSLKGQKPDKSPIGDFSGTLALKSADLQNLLDVLKLEAGLDGTGSITAEVKKTGSILAGSEIALTAINSKVELASGNTITVAGTISERAPATPDFDLNIGVDFAGAANAQKPAVFFADIRPSKLSLHVLGQKDRWTIEQVQLDTNAFDETLRKIGPFHGADIERSDEGDLQVTGIAFHVGPDDDPVAQIKGDIGDLLDFRDYTFQGSLDLPAQTLLPDIPQASAAKLGKLEGSFKLVDKAGAPALSNLTLKSVGSKLWSLSFGMDVRDLTELASWDINTSLDVPDSADFLRALQLHPVKAGAIHYATKFVFGDDSIETITDFNVGSTSVNAELTLGVTNNAPHLNGKIQSPLVQLSDLENAFQFGKTLATLRHEFGAVFATNSDSGIARSAEGVWLDLQKAPKGANAPKTSSPDHTHKIAIKDVIPLKNMLATNFLSVDVRIDKVSGVPGLNQLSGTVTGDKGNLTLTPLDLKLGDGHASMSAGIDLVNAPKRLRLKGRGDGWSLGEVMKEAGLKYAADGVLHAEFDLSGRYASTRAYIDTLQGAAQLGLENGEIGTSLIEFAGLGLLHWLFSKELADGATKITCIKADLRFADGEVTFKDAVLETSKVQLVASGDVDYVKGTIDIHANPRGLGHPLHRSAWPFTVTGSLQHPRVKAHFGTNRRWSPQVLAMPAHRVPCVPDVEQLKVVPVQ